MKNIKILKVVCLAFIMAIVVNSWGVESYAEEKQDKNIYYVKDGEEKVIKDTDTLLFNNNDTFKVKWEKVSGAEKYEIIIPGTRFENPLEQTVYDNEADFLASDLNGNGQVGIVVHAYSKDDEIIEKFLVFFHVRIEEDSDYPRDGDKIKLEEGQNLEVRFTDYSHNGDYSISLQDKHTRENIFEVTTSNKYCSIKNSVFQETHGDYILLICYVNGTERIAHTEIDIVVETEGTDTESMKIRLNKTKVTLNEGEECQLSAMVEPGNKVDKSVEWFSPDDDIASVDRKGKVTANGEGKVSIEATASNGAMASCKITVEPKIVESEIIEPKRLTLNKIEVTLNEGEKCHLSAMIEPQNTTDKSVRWTSLNEDIASVDRNGKVTANEQGRVDIEATSSNGIITTCCVTVESEEKIIEPKKIILNKTQVTLNKGEEYQLSAKIEPKNAIDKNIDWYSKNSDIVSVNGKGMVIAKSEGTTSIIAKAAKKVEAKCVITVEEIKSEILPTSISIRNNIEMIKLGEGAYLKADINPSDAKNKMIKWSSLNTSVATVNNEGYVYGEKEGIVTIQAQTINGKVDSYNILVQKKQINNKIRITINETEVLFNKEVGYPFLDENLRTQVPFRTTLESFGAKVSWDDEKQMACANKNGITVHVPINQSYIFVNDVKKDNDTGAVLIDEKTYCPIRKVLEAFSAKVDWDESAKTVIVTTNNIPLTLQK